MNPDRENFDRLRRLLALKHHEQPPPGYFDRFSGRVIQRIREGERAPDRLLDTVLGELPWLTRFWGLVQAKPILGGLCGAAFCLLLLLGVIQSEQPDPGVMNPTDPARVLQAAIPTADVRALAPAGPTSLLISNGVVTAEPRGSLFDELRISRPLAQPEPVGWHPGPGEPGLGLR